MKKIFSYTLISIIFTSSFLFFVGNTQAQALLPEITVTSMTPAETSIKIAGTTKYFGEDTQAKIIYGTNLLLTTPETTASFTVKDSSTPNFNYTLSGLSSNTQYYFKIVNATDATKEYTSVLTPPKTTDPLNINPNKQATSETTYYPLAKLPGIEEPINTAEDGAFAKYLNALIKLFIGICAVLAMIMIVMGGIEYMTSELISEKADGKNKITNAVFGLILALGAFAILNTINPQLLDISLDKLPTATITLDEQNFKYTEKNTASVGTGYKLSGTFANPAPSVGVLDFKNNYLTKGYVISDIIVNTSLKTATFMAKKANDTKYVAVYVNFGTAGVSEIGQAKEGDDKTPKGTTNIISDRRPPPTPPVDGVAALTKDGAYNLGAAFINFGATVNGKDRGMGFHGSYDNNLGSTNGCIRMHNDDLVALSPYMTSGVKVTIK